MNKLSVPTVALASVLALATACSSFNSKVVDPLLTDLGKISATAQADLTNAVAVANAATPVDTDGATCYQALLTVQAQIAKVIAANTVASAGVVSAAEIASLFQPGSAQYNQAANTIGTGCIAKANDVMGAVNVVALGGVAAVLPQIAPVLAAAP